MEDSAASPPAATPPVGMLRARSCTTEQRRPACAVDELNDGQAASNLLEFILGPCTHSTLCCALPLPLPLPPLLA